MAGMHVLLVEQEPVLRLTFAQLLEAGGYRVHAASDGDEALRLYSQMKPGAVIANVAAAGPAGEPLIETLRTENADVPIIATSGAIEKDAGERAMALGASAFIAKPFSGTQLIGLLGDMFGDGSNAAASFDTN